MTLLQLACVSEYTPHRIHTLPNLCQNSASNVVLCMGVGADEEFQLSMSFLRPAYGEVTVRVQFSCSIVASLLPQRFLVLSHLWGAYASTCMELIIPEKSDKCPLPQARLTIVFQLQVLMDLSCGSGLFTRRFVKSNQFQGVIAADYSETMLQQTRQLFNQDLSLNQRSAPEA